MLTARSLRAAAARPCAGRRAQCARASLPLAATSGSAPAGGEAALSSSGRGLRPITSRRLMVGLIGGGLLGGASAALAAEEDERRGERVVRTDHEWKELLTPGQYFILRKAGTELPRSSPLNGEKRRGTFVCAGCGSRLFSSDAKYNSGTGWPSFFEPLDGAVAETLDASIPFMVRTEVRCKSCGGHLGHVFDDGPPPTGLRYCMNGLALAFEPAGAQAAPAQAA